MIIPSPPDPSARLFFKNKIQIFKKKKKQKKDKNKVTTKTRRPFSCTASNIDSMSMQTSGSDLEEAIRSRCGTIPQSQVLEKCKMNEENEPFWFTFPRFCVPGVALCNRHTLSSSEFANQLDAFFCQESITDLGR